MARAARAARAARRRDGEGCGAGDGAGGGEGHWREHGEGAAPEREKWRASSNALVPAPVLCTIPTRSGGVTSEMLETAFARLTVVHPLVGSVASASTATEAYEAVSSPAALISSRYQAHA